LILTNSCSKQIAESDWPGPKAPALRPIHGFSTAVSCITQVAASLCSMTTGVAKQSQMKGYANVTIPSLPRAGRCFSCRHIDPDSTRFVESHCGGLPDCNRHTWSGGGKTHRPMVVERMILKHSSIGQRQIRPDHLFVLSRYFLFS